MRFLVFQHAASEHPGSFRGFMEEDGITWDTMALDEGDAVPQASAHDALLVLGGPMDVWEEDIHPWLRAEKAFIRDWVQAGRPYLGICLGHQLLADALGGAVGKMPEPEVGVCEVSLTDHGRASPFYAGVAPAFPALQWHGAAVTALPPGATTLAANAHCDIQALQAAPRAFGIQYHVEVIDRTASDWGAIPEYRCALESITGAGGQERLEAAVAAHLPQFNTAARTLYGNFLKVVRG